MKITGKYTQDDDFVMIFSDDDTLYTIDKGTLDCETLNIGDILPSGEKLTQELFENRKSQCTDEGVFVLQDNEDEEEEED